MEELTFIDGRKADKLPPRSLFYGEGLFETFRWNGKKPEYISSHIGRLKNSSRAFKIPFPYSEDHVIERVKKAVAESGGLSGDFYVKIALVSKGPSVFFENPSGSSLLVIIKPYTQPGENVSVCVASQRRNQSSVLLRHKTFNYLENIVSRREAVDRGFDDAVFLNTDDVLTEATSSNLFWAKGKDLFTPAVEAGVLPGITREAALNVAGSLDYRIRCGNFTLSSLLSSDFAFLTNSLRGTSLISKVDERVILSRSEGYIEIKNALLGKLKWDNIK